MKNHVSWYLYKRRVATAWYLEDENTFDTLGNDNHVKWLEEGRCKSQIKIKTKIVIILLDNNHVKYFRFNEKRWKLQIKNAKTL